MSLYDRIKALCDENHLAVTKLESELGFARGSIGKLRNQKGTSSERIEAIANFFSRKPLNYCKSAWLSGFFMF